MQRGSLAVNNPNSDPGVNPGTVPNSPSLWEQVRPYGNAAYRIGSSFDSKQGIIDNTLAIGQQARPITRGFYPYGPQTEADQPIVNTADNITSGANLGTGGLSLYYGLKNGDIRQTVRGARTLYGERAAVGLDGNNAVTDTVSQSLPYVDAGLGALNLYSGIKNKNYAQAGLGGVQVGAGLENAGLVNISGAANTAATSVGINTGTTAATTTTAANAPISFGDVLGPVATAYGAYQTTKTTGDMAAGSKRDITAATQAGLSTAASTGNPYIIAAAAFSAFVGSKLYGSSKQSEQLIRDNFRDFYKENKLVDDKYQMTLGDGTSFDFGKDGKKYGKLQNFENPVVKSSIMGAKLLAALDGAFGKNNEYLSTALTNAATSNAKDQSGADSNYKAFFKQRNIDPTQAKVALDNAYKLGNLKQGEYGAYTQELNRLFGQNFQATEMPKEVKQLQDPEAKKKFLALYPGGRRFEKDGTTPIKPVDAVTTTPIDPGGVKPGVTNTLPKTVTTNVPLNPVTQLEADKKREADKQHDNWANGRQHTLTSSDIIKRLRQTVLQKR